MTARAVGEGRHLAQVLAERSAQWTQWRRWLHAHPELAFEEHLTAGFVAQRLRALEGWGMQVHTGIARTGVVGVLTRGPGAGRIGLRADMDALPMQESNTFGYRSQHSGCMHGCGHDGHTAMLLAAAETLAHHGRFSGTVVFIFQPAEEAAGGGRAMVQDGLFDRFPVDAVYAMHNIPGIAAGSFGVMPGPMMASFDALDITVTGVGGHAAFPQRAVDAVHAAAQFVVQAQAIVARQLDPFEPAVLSFTELRAGEGYNVLPPSVSLRGTVRAFNAATQDRVEERLRAVGAGVDAALGSSTTIVYDRRYPATVNSPAQAETARQVLVELFGPQRVLTQGQALMAAEDFAFMLQARPGAYVWIGNGTGADGGCMVHNPGYDFNDAILGHGVRYWVGLVEHCLHGGQGSGQGAAPQQPASAG